SENSVFKNNGYSEIYWFKYAANCQPPTYLLSKADNPKTTSITWQGSQQHQRYHVQYKKKDIEGAEWFEAFTRNPQTKLTDLEAGQTYDFRVGATCEAPQYGVEDSYVYSGINTFTMPEKKETDAYNCGIMPDVKITNKTPLTNLSKGETFTAGDFPVTIVELNGESPYTGSGYIGVPYLAYVRLKVEFKSIVVNTDYQLIGGTVETTYDPTGKNIIDIDLTLESLEQLVDRVTTINIDKESKENIEKIGDALKEKVAKELPTELAEEVNQTMDNLVAYKESYDTAKSKLDEAVESGNTAAIAEAKKEVAAASKDFDSAKKEFGEIEKKRQEFIKTYGEIIKKALTKIVKDSKSELKGLEKYGEVSSKEVKRETKEVSLDEASDVLSTMLENAEPQKEDDKEAKNRFEYARWSTLQYISENLKTAEGAKTIGELVAAGEKNLGVFIYEAIKAKMKESDLVEESKNIIIDTVTEKVAIDISLQ
ncbi:MAG: hypothetical protein ACRCS4_05910, partial [Flavobacterium sp.]